MTSKCWVVLGRRRNNSGHSTENQGKHLSQPQETSRCKEKSIEQISGGNKIIREVLGLLRAEGDGVAQTPKCSVEDF